MMLETLGSCEGWAACTALNVPVRLEYETPS